MIPGIDPNQLANVQRISSRIKGTVIIDVKEGETILRFDSADKESRKAIPAMLEQFSKALADQLNMFFRIQGKIIMKNQGQPFDPSREGK
jgi:hypothetical protein